MPNEENAKSVDLVSPRGAGLLLLALPAVVYIWSTIIASPECDPDCGSLRAGLFVIFALSVPFALGGLGLIVTSLERDVSAGHPPARRWRTASSALRVGLLFATAATALLAVIFLALTVHELFSLTLADADGGPGYVPERDPGTLAVYGAVAFAWTTASWLARRTYRRTDRLLTLWS
jgi:hypothetical protein